MRDRDRRSLLVGLILVAVWMGRSVQAAGFYLPEIGTPRSLGTAGVANPTNNSDADCAWTNPAGMTGIAGQRILLGFQTLLPRVEFAADEVVNELDGAGFAGDVGGGDGGNAGEIAPIPSLFFVQPLADRVRLGFAMTAPVVAGVDYGADFIGRYALRDVTLSALALTPSFAYRVTDRLSLGVGVSLVHWAMERSLAVRQGAPVPALDARIRFADLGDWGLQGVLGVTFQVSDRLLLGLVYRSEADSELKGDVEIDNLRIPLPVKPPSGVEVGWTNPRWLELGLEYGLDAQTVLFFNLGWQEWSRFSDNLLRFDNGLIATLDRNWDDTWHAGIAMTRALGAHASISVGFAYESSPVHDGDRTFDLPVDEMWKLSAAYIWKPNQRLSLSLGGTLYLVGDASVEQTVQGVRVSGDYETNMAAIVGGTFGLRF